MQRPLVMLVLALVVLALAACGGGDNALTSRTERYEVQLSIDGKGFGDRTATVELRDHAGQPVSAEEVVIAPTMRQMGMASPEVVAQPAGNGRYEAKGAFFSMLGEWEVDVRVRAGDTEEVASFKMQVLE